MKISKEELGEIVEILSQAETFRPLVKVALETIKSYGPEIQEIPKAMSKWFVQNRIESVAAYEAAGFTRAEAITMTLDDVQGIKKFLRQVGKNNNNS